MTEAEFLDGLGYADFVALVEAILKANGTKLVDSERTDGITAIVGSKQGDVVAAMIVNPSDLDPGKIKKLLKTVAENWPEPDRFEFFIREKFKMADLPSLPSGPPEVVFYDREAIIKQIQLHPHVTEDVQEARRIRRHTLFRNVVLPGIAVVAGFIGFGFSAFVFPRTDGAGLKGRIVNVESALTSLKDLEKQLDTIKADMQKTADAKAAIESEYEKARSLENLTNQQLESVSRAINRQSWVQVGWNYLIGFATGIATSYLASHLYDMTQGRKVFSRQESVAVKSVSAGEVAPRMKK